MRKAISSLPADQITADLEAVVDYEGAGHGFIRAGEDPGDKNPENKKAREEAWKRWKDLLKKL